MTKMNLTLDILIYLNISMSKFDLFTDILWKYPDNDYVDLERLKEDNIDIAQFKIIADNEFQDVISVRVLWEDKISTFIAMKSVTVPSNTIKKASCVSSLNCITEDNDEVQQ